MTILGLYSGVIYIKQNATVYYIVMQGEKMELIQRTYEY